MNIDERLAYLAEQHKTLAESVQVLTAIGGGWGSCHASRRGKMPREYGGFKICRARIPRYEIER